MNDAQSTIVGLKAQDCPGGGWNGMPVELERATVADCLSHGVCGCIYGEAVQHIERLRAQLVQVRGFAEIMTADNWRDYRLYIKRAADEQSKDITS